MNTFYQMWGVLTPEEAKAKIEEQKKEALAALNGRERLLRTRDVNGYGGEESLSHHLF